jgi:preprotein translocase subunit SecG
VVVVMVMMVVVVVMVMMVVMMHRLHRGVFGIGRRGGEASGESRGDKQFLEHC